MGPQKPSKPHSVILRFMQAYMRHAIEDMTAVLQENDLSMPQLGTLQFLRAEGAQSVTSVARHLNLSLTATSHLINRLVQKGLLHREEDAEDRRQKRVTLTAAGDELVAQIHRRSAASLDALLQRVPGERREALERAVEAVVAELEGDG